MIIAAAAAAAVVFLNVLYEEGQGQCNGHRQVMLMQVSRRLLTSLLSLNTWSHDKEKISTDTLLCSQGKKKQQED